MSDPLSSHPSEDELLELALGSLSSDSEAAILKHVNACLTCRSTYDEISRTVDATLPASPAVAPPAGFEVRALERIGIRPAPARTSRRLPLLVAAAVAAGILAGGVGAVVIRSADSPSTTAAVEGETTLRTGNGDDVGSVLQSRYEGKTVLVLRIARGVPGMHYTCRLRLGDGSALDAGEWIVPDSGSAVWITPAPSDLVGVELVTESGTVWSTAPVRS